MDEMTLELNSPITEEQWDILEDVDFDNTESICFHTKHGKKVEFVKRKRGEWVYSSGRPATIGSSFGVICTACKKESEYCTKFCPNCGADMRGEARWLHSDDLSETLVCSACGYDTEDYEPYASCPNCGARMVKRSEG